MLSRRNFLCRSFYRTCKIDLPRLPVHPPSSLPSITTAAVPVRPRLLLLFMSTGPFSGELLPFTFDNPKYTFQTPSPHHQPPLNLCPLFLAKDTICRPLYQKLLLHLAQLPLHQSCTDRVDDPNLDVGCRDLKGLCNF